MEYCITINPIPHSQYRTKFDYEWSIEYQLIRNPLVSVNIRSANLLIFKILYYGMHHECALLVDVRLPLQTTQYTQIGDLDFVLAEPIRVFIFLFNHVLSMYPTILCT